MVDVDMKFLPKGTKGGDVQRVENGIYTADTDPTAERALHVKRLMDGLSSLFYT